jgi:hypothetical protein
MEKTLSIEPVEAEQVFNNLVRVTLKKSDTTGGAESVKEMCRNAKTFKVVSDGSTVGAYAVRVVNHDNLSVAWVTAAEGNMRGVKLLETVIPAIEAQAKELGAEQVSMNTKRRGMIKKLIVMGYEITGVTLRKKI